MSGKSTLRFITAGSVDNGKSTLIGRLLLDTRALSDDQLRDAEASSRSRGRAGIDLSFFTDGLSDEREQGITIDVAYRYFTTATRRFILADCPGHAQYTRNMITGASTADVALILVDVRNGLTEQTCRHICLSSLLGISAIVICVNKMDAVGFAEEHFHTVQQSVLDFALRLSGAAVHVIPVSALVGDNVVVRSDSMPWYNGPTVLEFLETFTPTANGDRQSRFPVQCVFPYGDDSGMIAVAGRVAGGHFSAGKELTVLPSGQRTLLRRIEWNGHELDEAGPGMSVLFAIESNTVVWRGDMLVNSDDRPEVTRSLSATICWLADDSIAAGDQFLLRLTGREVMCTAEQIHHCLDIRSLDSVPAAALQTNDIGRVTFSLAENLPADRYQQNRETGSFILIDIASGETLAAGMINTFS